MYTFTRALAAYLVVSVVAVCVSGCGSSSGSSSDGLPGDVVAQIGDTSITQATLSHWMSAVTGGDFYEHIGSKAPVGLVSDPPNYARCIVAAEQITPKSSKGTSVLSREQLLGKCHQLNKALEEQTLTLLLSFDQTTGEAAELGLSATGSEVNRMFAETKATTFPKEGQFQEYLAARHWDLETELVQLKRNLIVMKILAKFKQAAAKSGGKWQTAYVNYVESSKKKWAAKITCRAGYVVEACKQYKQPATEPPAPAPLLEALVAGQ
jgi:hypothetical protein